MPEPTQDELLDRSSFDDAQQSPAKLPVLVTSTEGAAIDPRLVAEPAPFRLVEVGNLSPEDGAEARQSATRIDFHKTATLLAHGDGVLAEIAQSSRQLLTGVRPGDAGEVGRITASIIEGVKILRIQDLQAEAASAGQLVAGPPCGRTCSTA